MRTNIEIDNALMDSVLASGHYKTKKDAVEAGLALLKHRIAQKELIALRGTIDFFDDTASSKNTSYPRFSREISKVAESSAL